TIVYNGGLPKAVKKSLSSAAQWQSGYAADCKSVYVGSIPACASKGRATHMDSQVIAAMARWPDVPDVYGWLSLSSSGHWRLHPLGDAIVLPDSPGEAITSPQILAFLGRNYAADAQGQW